MKLPPDSGKSVLILFEKGAFQNCIDMERDLMKNIVKIYGGNPYPYLVDMGKLAQNDGVIKEILMHQGESNTNDSQCQARLEPFTTILSKH